MITRLRLPSLLGISSRSSGGGECLFAGETMLSLSADLLLRYPQETGCKGIDR